MDAIGILRFLPFFSDEELDALHSDDGDHGAAGDHVAVLAAGGPCFAVDVDGAGGVFVVDGFGDLGRVVQHAVGVGGNDGLIQHFVRQRARCDQRRDGDRQKDDDLQPEHRAELQREQRGDRACHEPDGDQPCRRRLGDAEDDDGSDPYECHVASRTSFHAVGKRHQREQNDKDQRAADELVIGGKIAEKVNKGTLERLAGDGLLDLGLFRLDGRKLVSEEHVERRVVAVADVEDLFDLRVAAAGITYTSAERSPVVLPEMAELLPPLSAEQSAALEEDLLRNGCYSPIIVNEDMVIVDGHNRQALCEKHGLPYTMAVFSFEDLLEAKQWALDTQKGRRNLEKWELGKIALKLKPEIEAKAKANMAAGGQNFRPSEAEEGLATLPNLPSVEKAVDTRKELAEAVGLGERTMGKVMQIDENAPEVIKEALDKKELSINKGYDLTRQLQDIPEEQREQAAAEALEYEKAKKELKKQDAEIDRKGKIAALFCKAYEKAILLTPSEENVRCWTDGTRMTPEEMRDTVKESREIAQVFAAIADIIEQKILPADWRCVDAGNEENGAQPDGNPA